MLLLRSQIGIAVFAECVRLLIQVRTHIDGALILKRRWIAARDTIVAHQFERIDPSVIDQIAHPRLVGENIGQAHLGIVLPSDLLTKGGVVVHAQTQVDVVAVAPPEVVLDVHTAVVEVAEPLVSIDGAGACHHACAVAHVLTLVEALVVVGAEILEASGEDIAVVLVLVVLPLPIDFASDAIVVTVAVGDTASIGSAFRLHLRVNEVLVGLNQFVGIVSVVHADGGMESEVANGAVLQLLRGLEALHALLVVLQRLGLRDKLLHLLELVGRSCVDIGGEIVLHAILAHVGEIGGCTTLGEPQARIVALIAVAVTTIVLGYKAKGIGVLQLIAQGNGRAEADVILALVVAIMDERARVLAHACPKRVTHTVVATRERQRIALLEPGLVQQVLGAVKMIELAVSHIGAHLHGRSCAEAPLTMILGEDLDDTIGCVRAIERCGGSTGHILDVVDVLHRYVADGARGGRLAVDVAIGVVHHIEQRRARVEVVDTHTVDIDDRCAIGECR